MLFIFDLDGTLCAHGTSTLLPAVQEKCQALLAEGHDLAIATNSLVGAVGNNEERMRMQVADVANSIGAIAWEACSAAAPQYRGGVLRGVPPCMKPNPGMLLTLMDRTGHSAAATVMVGDGPEDMGAADLAGVAFAWAPEFFDR